MGSFSGDTQTDNYFLLIPLWTPARYNKDITNVFVADSLGRSLAE